MHVLYLSSYFPVLSETFVYNEVLRLRSAGITVSTASLRHPDDAQADPTLDALRREVMPVYGAGLGALLRDAIRALVARPRHGVGTLLKGLADMFFARDLPLRERPKIVPQVLAGLALGHRARQLAIDHVHAHFAHAPATVAMYLAAYLGVSFSFTGHANDLFQRRTLLPTKLRRAAFVACISHWHRAYYREFAPELSDDRLPVIRCGVDVPASQAHTPNEPPQIFAVGRLVPKKGFDVLIEALGQLHTDGVAFSCTLIGDGPQRAELESLVHKHDLSKHVQLLGATPHAEILTALQQADLFVLPCQPDKAGDRDGIPVALMEAMAVGKTVISGELPAIRELIQDGETGCLVPPGDVQALTRAIRTQLADANTRAAFGTAARNWVEQEFSATVNTRRLEDAFKSAMVPQRLRCLTNTAEETGDTHGITHR